MKVNISRRDFGRRCAIGTFGTLMGCGARMREAPNVILIVLDTVRADHLTCYDSLLDSSPFINSFSKTSTVYDSAISTAPYTIASHASLFTGLYPSEHGSHSISVGDEKEPRLIVRSLHDSHNTLAKALKSEGFVTNAISANVNFKGRNLLQGFDDSIIQRMQAPATNKLVLEWLDVNRSRPFFLFVNYIDAHIPYNTNPVKGFINNSDLRAKGLMERLMRLVLDDGYIAPPALVERIKNQYNTAIRNLDLAIEELITRIQKLDLYDNTMIILTSDHGESFGEHGLVEHGLGVYSPEIRVPLLIKQPNQVTHERPKLPVSLVGIPHAVISVMPVEVRQKWQDQFPRTLEDAPILSESHLMGDRRRSWASSKELRERFSRTERALIQWPHKLIKNTNGKLELFEIEEDIRELTDRSATAVSKTTSMETSLASLLTSLNFWRDNSGLYRAQEQDLSPGEIEDMNALGYI